MERQSLKEYIVLFCFALADKHIDAAAHLSDIVTIWKYFLAWHTFLICFLMPFPDKTGVGKKKKISF